MPRAGGVVFLRGPIAQLEGEIFAYRAHVDPSPWTLFRMWKRTTRGSRVSFGSVKASLAMESQELDPLKLPSCLLAWTFTTILIRGVIFCLYPRIPSSKIRRSLMSLGSGTALISFGSRRWLECQRSFGEGGTGLIGLCGFLRHPRYGTGWEYFAVDVRWLWPHNAPSISRMRRKGRRLL